MKLDPPYQLDAMFNPRSIAVVGASEKIGKWGTGVINSLVTGNPDVNIYPVNPKRDEVFGLKAYSNVREIPGDVDLAVIAIPLKAIPETLDDCVEKGARIAIIITAGFSETGETGKQLEEKIVEIARDGGMRIVGPNCMGHLNIHKNLSTVPVIPEKLENGNISIISQSGNFGVYILRIGLMKGLKFNKLISGGNEADLHFEDYLEYLGGDPGTEIIVGYVEELREGRRFLDLASEIGEEKPIFVLKAGRTEAGSEAAKSHTGAMAGEDAVYDSIFRQAGVIRVENLQSLFDTVKAFQLQPLPNGKRVGVVTAGGGFGVLAADACEELGLEVPDLSEKTMDELNEILPPRWSRGNPVDMAGSRTAAFDCLTSVLKDENIDIVLAIYTIGYATAVLGSSMSSKSSLLQKLIADEKSELKKFINLARKLEKPIISAGVFSDSQVISLEDPLLRKIPTYPSPERAARVIHDLTQLAKI